MTKATRTDVYAALAQMSGFEVVKENETATQLRIMGRNHPDRWPFLLPVIFTLRKAEKKPTCRWKCDISKEYFEANDRILYAWRFIFKADNLAEYYGDIISTIRSAPRPARVEVESMTLPGYKPGQVHGGVNARGKGVAAADSIPMILTRRGG